ncbi:MAG: ABC transporter ATP-binding protein [bacterium]|nr:ABC transporter ATP-binding protein [bacterium]
MIKFIKKILNLSEVFRVLNESFRGFRVKLLGLALLGFLGGLLESVGINVLIPVFSFFTKSSIPAEDFISRNITKYLSYLPFEHDLIFLISLTISLFLIRAIVLILFSYFSYTTMIDYKNQSVKSLLKSVFAAKWTFLLGKKLGYIQATIFRDMQTTSDTMVYLSRFIVSSTGLLVYLFFALNISSGITSLTLLVGMLAVLMLFPFVKKNRATFGQMAETEKLVSSYLIENISGAKNVKSLTVEDRVIEKGEGFYDLMKVLNMKIVVFRSALANFMQPVSLVFISSLFYYYSKQPNFNLPSFIVTVYLIQKIFTYLDNTQAAFHSVNEQTPFLKNILAFKNEVEKNKEDTSGKKPFKFSKTLHLDKIGFSYEDGHPILSDIDIKIKKGEVVGLIGPSGAGKSSVADLLLKFLKPTDGRITLDGIDINEIETKSWRKSIGYVSQDVFLMHDTIENNIRFYDDGVTDEDIKMGAELANAIEFIDKQSKGFKTLVGDRGVMLSGGQRQRIVLARILARKPSVIILDEATSALDNESELLIQKAIHSLKGRITIIIIAHRLSTVMDADRLFVLDNGRVVEEGDPKKLIEDEDSYFYKTYHLKK